MPQPDLRVALAPHLSALSSATALLAPLNSVLTALISELVALRTDHDALLAHVRTLARPASPPDRPVSAAEPGQTPVAEPAPLPASEPDPIPAAQAEPIPETLDPDATQPPPHMHNASPPVPLPTCALPNAPASPGLLSPAPLSRAQPDAPPPPAERGMQTPPVVKQEPEAEQARCPSRLKRAKRSSRRSRNISWSSLYSTDECLSTPEQHPQPPPLVVLEPPADQTTVPKTEPRLQTAGSLQTPIAKGTSSGLRSSSGKRSKRDKRSRSAKLASHKRRIPFSQLPLNASNGAANPVVKAIDSPEKRTPKQSPSTLAIPGFRTPAAVARTVDFIQSRQNPDHAYHEVVRGNERKALAAAACQECEDFFRKEAEGHSVPQEAYHRLVQHGCRHRERIPRPDTPKGYWQLTFEETPTQPP